jgi:hypothetical protein
MTIKSALAGAAAVTVIAAGAALAAVPAASASPQSPHPAAVKHVTSKKWAGYAALASRTKDVRYVAADFIVPSPNVCGRQDQSGGVTTTQWIGLGGYSRGVPERIGVFEHCDFNDDVELEFGAVYSGASGSGSFFGCLEAHGSTCPRGIDGGDRVELSVYYNGRSYRMILRDVTKKRTRTVYLGCRKCRSTSAEVISIATSTSTIPPLTSLSGGNFFGVRVTSADGIHGTMAPQPRHWTTVAITQLNSAGDTIGKPYPLRRHGRAFNVAVYGFTGGP